jgi:hypothetical protein
MVCVFRISTFLRGFLFVLDLHPLALEDVLHQRGRARSKADYYQKHLFLRILCHSLADEDDISANDILPATHPRAGRHTMTGLPRSSSPIPMSELDTYDTDGNGVIDLEGDTKEVDEDGTAYDGSTPLSRFSSRRGKGSIFKRRPFLGAGNTDIENPRDRLDRLELQTKQKNMRRDVISIEQLKKGERVNVKVVPMFIFLLRDGLCLICVLCFAI